jgi:hypothetical protein
MYVEFVDLMLGTVKILWDVTVCSWSTGTVLGLWSNLLPQYSG